MSSGKAGGRRTTTDSGGGEAEVEELLRAAQDDLLLNLHVNSHSISSASEFSSLDSDLTRRFQALKTNPSTSIPTASPNPPPASLVTKGEGETSVDCDELAVRFAKLKGSIGSNEAIESKRTGGNGDETEDEVEKLMQWAMDAARLDPSGNDKLDEDDKIDTSDDDDEEEEEEKEEELDKGKAEESRSKGKFNKRKWFLF